MHKIAIAIFALCLSFNTSADTWLTINTGSYHVNAKKNYNQQNYGAGIEYQSGELILMAGGYRNSAYKNSLYAMGGWLPLKYGNIKAGAMLGIVNGYPGMNDGGIIPVAAGIVSAEYGHVGVNLILLPTSKEKTPLTLGFQVKFKF